MGLEDGEMTIHVLSLYISLSWLSRCADVTFCVLNDVLVSLQVLYSVFLALYCCFLDSSGALQVRAFNLYPYLSSCRHLVF